MKDLSKHAEEYAAARTTEMLNKAFAQAYMDGYKDGYQDGVNGIPVSSPIAEDEFVDLGLTSGTLWSRSYVKNDNGFVYLAFGDASDLSIPTLEQWRELEDQCDWRIVEINYSHYARCLGPNGNYIDFQLLGRDEGKVMRRRGEAAFFWLNYGAAQGDQESPCTGCIERSDRSSKSTTSSKTCFSGYRLPVRLVKKDK